MCAIVGVHTDKPNACLTLYNAMTVLQHRGQDAAGMATFNKHGKLNIYKNNGLVRDVFNEESILYIDSPTDLCAQIFFILTFGCLIRSLISSRPIYPVAPTTATFIYLLIF